MNNVSSPDNTDPGIERAIQAAGADKAPRVTMDDILANIESAHYFTAAQGVDGADIERLRAQDQAAPLTIQPITDDPQIWRTSVIGPLRLLTFCVLTLRNGFTVTGQSACVSPENFNAEIGQRVAREDAIRQVGPLMGYALKQDLWRASLPQMTPAPDVEAIARVAHEVNRAYCASQGDDTQVAWDAAPEWQKESARNGVLMHLANPDATPEDSHNSWLAEKAANGWTYGPVKDADKKEHPCFTGYENLPLSQRAKDYLFRALVHALRTS